TLPKLTRPACVSSSFLCGLKDGSPAGRRGGDKRRTYHATKTWHFLDETGVQRVSANRRYGWIVRCGPVTRFLRQLDSLLGKHGSYRQRYRTAVMIRQIFAFSPYAAGIPD